MASSNLDFDVVIVGSGAGGGAVAKELAPLAQQGARIGVFEWGRRYRDAENLRDEVSMAPRYYFDAGTFQTQAMDMTLAFAKAVGGSTTVYTGTSLKMPPRVYEKWSVEGITETELEPRYEKYIRENNVHLNPEEALNENNILFRRGCFALGLSAEQFPVNTKNCQGLGTCNLGCAAGAKQGTDRVQLPMAEKQGVRVFPNCKVLKVDSGSLLVEARPDGSGNDGLEAGLHQVKARAIVISAGAINSPALLLRSGLGRELPALGRYFTCQPALILAGEHPRPIENSRGHPKSFYLDAFAESKRFLLETCMYFPVTLAKSMAGFGAEFDEFLSRYDRLQMILALAIDSAEAHNRVCVSSSGEPLVHYRFSSSVVQSFLEAVRVATKIFFAAGASRVHAPGAGRFLVHREQFAHMDTLVKEENFKIGQVPIAAAHLMGGCRMGSDLNSSVTDSFGRVHGHRGLYVADASLFPSACEINPYLTIMALADRVAEGVRKDLGA